MKKRWLQQVFPPDGGTAIVDMFPSYRKDIEKARSLPVGSTTTRKDGEYKKVAAGKWKKVSSGGSAAGSLQKSANAVADRILKKTRSEYEIGVVLDKSGNIISEKNGGKNSVKYSTYERKKLFGGRLFVHNHPSTLSFSPQDILFAYGNGLEEIWAVTNTVRYKYRPDFKGVADKTTGVDARKADLEGATEVANGIIRTVERVESNTKDEFWTAIDKAAATGNVGARETAIEWAQKNHGHRMMQELVNTLGGEYTVEKKIGDKWVPYKGQYITSLDIPLEKSRGVPSRDASGPHGRGDGPGGGRADGSGLADHLKKKGEHRRGSAVRIDPRQLAMGIRVEMEHSDNREVAREIALDHLAEDPNYYTHLQEMENKYTKSVEGQSMEKSNIALVVLPGELSKSHPAKLSKPGGNTKSKIPYEGHAERMKLAKMAAQRMISAGHPEKENAHSDNPTADHNGRVAGGKAPYSGYATGVSGDDSQAHDIFGRQTQIVKPSELGSSAPEGTTKHTPVKSVGKKKR